jgi:hypothetical protein
MMHKTSERQTRQAHQQASSTPQHTTTHNTPTTTPPPRTAQLLRHAGDFDVGRQPHDVKVLKDGRRPLDGGPRAGGAGGGRLLLLLLEPLTLMGWVCVVGVRGGEGGGARERALSKALHREKNGSSATKHSPKPLSSTAPWPP